MDRYELKGELGDGSFGKVMKAALKETGEEVAIKNIKRKFKTWEECVSLREVTSLRNMSHPNIVPILEVIRESDESLYFVFEYMSGGSLYEIMKARMEDRKAGNASRRLSEGLVRSYIMQILCGLSYIHSQGYIHRDIKPENVLVKGKTCKVADFGLARQVGGESQLTYYVSTRWYRAPEIILQCPSYGKPVDIFSTGLIFAELFSLRPLFPGSGEVDQLSKMMRVLGAPSERTWEEGTKKMRRINFELPEPEFEGEAALDEFREEATAEAAIRKTLPANTPNIVAKLIRQMICWNPSSRPTAQKTLDHDYFQPPKAPRKTVGDNGSARERLKDEKTRQVEPESHFRHRPAILVDAMRPSKTKSEANEFTTYLDQRTSHTQADSGNVRQYGTGSFQQSGNRIRQMFRGRKQDTDGGNQPSGMQEGFGSDMPTLSARRNNWVATNTKFGTFTPARKSTRKPPKRRSAKGGVDKPRWLLSSQNMGKRAMEVSISRPIPSFDGDENTHNADKNGICLSNQPNENNPFTCLE